MRGRKKWGDKRQQAVDREKTNMWEMVGRKGRKRYWGRRYEQ